MPRKRTISYQTKEGQKIKESREEKLSQIQLVVKDLEEKRKLFREKEKMSLLLADVSKGLYEEVDKLFKKSPLEPITKLTLESVNEVIADTKETITKDIYVQRIKRFEAAGDNPEVRDVVMILNLIMKGLARFLGTVKSSRTILTSKIHEALMIKECLEQFIQYDQELDKYDAYFGEDFPK